jgi:hypothetical protein
VQRVSRVPQLVEQKRALARESYCNFRRFSLAQALRNIPEVHALFFEAVSLSKGRLVVGELFNQLPQTGDSHEKNSVLCSNALRFDNRLCVMGDQCIKHSPQAKCSI